jgi:hypothetical protein
MTRETLATVLGAASLAASIGVLLGIRAVSRQLAAPMAALRDMPARCVDAFEAGRAVERASATEFPHSTD